MGALSMAFNGFGSSIKTQSTKLAERTSSSARWPTDHKTSFLILFDSDLLISFFSVNLLVISYVFGIENCWISYKLLRSCSLIHFSNEDKKRTLWPNLSSSCAARLYAHRPMCGQGPPMCATRPMSKRDLRMKNRMNLFIELTLYLVYSEWILINRMHCAWSASNRPETVGNPSCVCLNLGNCKTSLHVTGRRSSER